MPGGRPRKSGDDKRDRAISIRLKPDEFEKVAAAARAFEESVSEYARSQILGGADKPMPLDDYLKASRHPLVHGSRVCPVCKAAKPLGALFCLKCAARSRRRDFTPRLDAAEILLAYQSIRKFERQVHRLSGAPELPELYRRVSVPDSLDPPMPIKAALLAGGARRVVEFDAPGGSRFQFWSNGRAGVIVVLSREGDAAVWQPLNDSDSTPAMFDALTAYLSQKP
jgi:hypothetical protein